MSKHPQGHEHPHKPVEKQKPHHANNDMPKSSPQQHEHERKSNPWKRGDDSKSRHS